MIHILMRGKNKMESKNKKIIASFAVTPNILQQLREQKERNGTSISWLINSLLKEYFTNVGGKRNGE